ncbi:MAG TPA: subclass B3 metallo-beta-lactamase [Caulobacterales bacterium]|nr:subclass B3 metallo-beta-lactamase [Caulobacterales bacterium]
MRRRVLLGALAVIVAALAALALSPALREDAWSLALRDNAPVAPFQIAPGLDYVGSSDIGVYALTTRDGIILIDAGYESTAARIPANLRALGLDPANVRIILNTHAHFDHAAGIAAMQRLTGAQVYASPGDAPELRCGGRGNFFLGDWMTFPLVRVDHVLHDGEQVRLGERVLTAHFTPGHTKGCTSWTFPIVVDGQERQALIICSLSTLRYRLVDNRDYPNIAADYEHTYSVLHHLPCEVFLGAHAKWFDMDRKRRALAAGRSPNPFVDPIGCRTHIDTREAAFFRELERQGGHPPSPWP